MSGKCTQKCSKKWQQNSKAKLCSPTLSNTLLAWQGSSGGRHDGVYQLGITTLMIYCNRDHASCLWARLFMDRWRSTNVLLLVTIYADINKSIIIVQFWMLFCMKLAKLFWSSRQCCITNLQTVLTIHLVEIGPRLKNEIFLSIDVKSIKSS